MMVSIQSGVKGTSEKRHRMEVHGGASMKDEAGFILPMVHHSGPPLKVWGLLRVECISAKTCGPSQLRHLLSLSIFPYNLYSGRCAVLTVSGLEINNGPMPKNIDGTEKLCTGGFGAL